MVMVIDIKDRVKCAALQGKIVTAYDAALLINPNDKVGISGFTPSGYAKAVPLALAERMEKEPFKIDLWTGASVGDEADGALTRANGINRRFPYQTNGDTRKALNSGAVKYIDMHLSTMAQNVRYGFFGDLDVAIIEAAQINEDGSIVPTTSVGNSPTFVSQAKKVIVEVNVSQPLSLVGMHDIYEPLDPPHRKPIPLETPGDRIGTEAIPCDPSKIVAVVPCDVPDTTRPLAPIDDDAKAMSQHLIKFFEQEIAEGRLPKNLLPLQSGVGSVANAVISGLAKGPFTDLSIYTEVIQDGMFDFYAVVELEGDQEHSNDKTAVARIKVNPAGTTPWTNIVTSGKDESEDTHGPCMNSDTYERTQSVYLASEIKADKDGNIKRLGYIYNANDNLTDRTDPFHVKIYLAHTDKESFTSRTQWLPNNELTLVYDGTFTLEPGRNNILAFDLNTPFKYDKTKNLIVVFEKEDAVPSNLMFCAVYKVFNANTSNIYRMLEYAEASPFEVTKSHAYNSAPILYLGFDVANNISNAHVANKTFFYDTNTDMITFDKNVKVANFYSVDGKIVKTVKAMGIGRTKVNLPTGLYIVRTIDKNGVVTSVKLNVK